MSGFQVAIDGPVGSGKSTVARIVADRTGFLHIDTGAMYRAVGLLAARAGIDADDGEAVAALLPSADIRLEISGVFLNGEDVSAAIRSPEASLGASAVAKHKAVRAALVTLQQAMAADRDVVMDGRDIGTRVLPDARLKVYLDASPSIRAGRRFLELSQKGENTDYDTVLKDLERRDYNDSHRAEDPLRVAEGAVVLDTAALDAEGVAAAIIDIIKDLMKER
ncbi:MAG: (d)CMP kinase [Clostridiales bacterium]|nr:(d)CMP kinase [Clostridiales bacterium]